LLGAVAYDPKVVTIWNGFREWLFGQRLPFDTCSTPTMNARLRSWSPADRRGWNSPLAWIRPAPGRSGRRAGPGARDARFGPGLTSVVVVRADDAARTLDDLRGRLVGVGAVDSPQATLLPLAHLRRAGLNPGQDVWVRRLTSGSGSTATTSAASATRPGRSEPAGRRRLHDDANHLLFSQEGTLPAGSTRILAQTGSYDHCNMTIGRARQPKQVETFRDCCSRCRTATKRCARC